MITVYRKPWSHQQPLVRCVSLTHSRPAAARSIQSLSRQPPVVSACRALHKNTEPRVSTSWNAGTPRPDHAINFDNANQTSHACVVTNSDHPKTLSRAIPSLVVCHSHPTQSLKVASAAIITTLSTTQHPPNYRLPLHAGLTQSPNTTWRHFFFCARGSIALPNVRASAWRTSMSLASG